MRAGRRRPGARARSASLHGRGEQIEKYFETVRDLRDRGFAVAMIDWRGQGHSSRRLRDPRKGYVRDFSDYEVDVETFVQQVVLPDCPPPFFALAHSMGGAVMLRLAHAGKRWFDRMVLSAPMIDLPGRATALPVRLLLKAMRLGRAGRPLRSRRRRHAHRHEPFVNNPVTTDPVRYARNAAILEEDPTLGIASPTVAWADTSFRAMHTFRQMHYPSNIRQPILMLAASNDEVVSTSAIEEFAYHLRAGSHLVIAGSRHEILQEQDRYRAAILGGVRRLRAGHAAVWVTPELVMAGLVPAIYVFLPYVTKDVDARHKAGHDERLALSSWVQEFAARLTSAILP